MAQAAWHRVDKALASPAHHTGEDRALMKPL